MLEWTGNAMIIPLFGSHAFHLFPFVEDNFL